ncbi:hypothetical protein GCM10010286_38220 [Streptomyces toxytricini]|nr:hypothetical protein GCM10010286_38220 [Streptomyces toxytricini]
MVGQVFGGAGRVRVGLVGGVAAGAALLSGCVPSGTDGKAGGPASSPSAAPPAPALVIGKEQAEKVFNTFAWEQSQFVKPGGQQGIASVATDPLLAEYRARAGVPSDRGTAPTPQTGPQYLIPAERDWPSHPRWFAVVSRNHSQRVERAAMTTYFTQAEPGGQWKAAAMTWMHDKPAPQLGEGEFEDRGYERFGFAVRDEEVAEVTRDAAGAAAAVPGAEEDRRVCGRYADHLSFTAPNGDPDSEHFAPGKLTSDVVRDYNHPEDELGGVRRSYGLEVTGPALPVLRLANGKSLVTCSFVRTDHWQGKSGGGTSWRFKFGKDDPRNALLGGGSAYWRKATVRHSMTVTFEVPPQGKADVVGCNCLKPALLSAEGTAS